MTLDGEVSADSETVKCKWFASSPQQLNEGVFSEDALEEVKMKPPSK
jgi:uncharacterized protein YodC (DUF2158 family)